jgi:ABC-type Fe3+ transport system permease subunit
MSILGNYKEELEGLMVSCSALAFWMAQETAKAMQNHERRRINRRKTLRKVGIYSAILGILLLWILILLIVVARIPSLQVERRIP